jgi:hypothetical protein
LTEITITLVGFASGVVTPLVFLTGRPSIIHFLPVSRTSLEKFLPSPATKWKFVVNGGTLYLRNGSQEIPVLPELPRVKDYRIRVSPTKSRYLVIYRRDFNERYETLLVVNANGSGLETHKYPSGLVDALWITESDYLVYLKPDYSRRAILGENAAYPMCWRHLKPESVGTLLWDLAIESANYLVQLNAANEIVGVRRY